MPSVAVACFQDDFSSVLGQENATRFPCCSEVSSQNRDASRSLRPLVCRARRAGPSHSLPGARAAAGRSCEAKSTLRFALSCGLRAGVDGQRVWAAASKGRFAARRLLFRNAWAAQHSKRRGRCSLGREPAGPASVAPSHRHAASGHGSRSLTLRQGRRRLRPGRRRERRGWASDVLATDSSGL